MSRQQVSFIATKYKKQPMRVNFYTQDGQRVDFKAVKKVATREGVKFYVERGRKK